MIDKPTGAKATENVQQPTRDTGEAPTNAPAKPRRARRGAGAGRIAPTVARLEGGQPVDELDLDGDGARQV